MMCCVDDSSRQVTGTSLTQSLLGRNQEAERWFRKAIEHAHDS